MLKRVGVLMAIAVVTVALVAGCGGSSPKPTTAAAPAPAPDSGGVAPTPAATTPASGTSAVAQELATCVSTAARSKRSPSGKATYLALCKQAVNGHNPAIKLQAKQQCLQIIRTTVPAAAQATLDAVCLKV